MPRTIVKAHSVDDLLGLVPYLLGFHPVDSLVIVQTKANRVVVTARLDLDDAAKAETVESLLERLQARFPSSQSWFAVYGGSATRAWRVLRRCVRAAPQAMGAVHVDGRSWRATPGGPPHPYVFDSSTATVQAEQAGMVAKASRDALAATVAGPSKGELPALNDLFDREATSLAHASDRSLAVLMRHALQARYDSKSITTVGCARLALLAQHPSARDVVFYKLTADEGPLFVDLWKAVVRHCPPPYQAHPLGLLGLAAWVSGDGALSTICLERAAAIDPETPLVSLLRTTNDMVLPPSAWPGIHRELTGHMRDGASPPSDAICQAATPAAAVASPS